jgi:hypothetical protein
MRCPSHDALCQSVPPSATQCQSVSGERSNPCHQRERSAGASLCHHDPYGWRLPCGSGSGFCHHALVVWNRSSPHYRRTLRDSLGRELIANAGVRGRPIMPSALTAHERGVLKRQIRPHRFARPYKWTKSADKIPASEKSFRHSARHTLCSEL